MRSQNALAVQAGNNSSLWNRHKGNLLLGAFATHSARVSIDNVRAFADLKREMAVTFPLALTVFRLKGTKKAAITEAWKSVVLRFRTLFEVTPSPRALKTE